MSAIRISPQATKDEVVAWAREQMARLGQPVPDLYTADHVLGILALFLIADAQPDVAAQVAERVDHPPLAESIRRAARGERPMADPLP